MPGFDNTAFDSDSWEPYGVSLLTHDTWAFEQSLFRTRQPGEIPAGDNINFGIEYSTTDNGGTIAPWESVHASDTVDGIGAYFTKTYYSNSGMTDQILQARESGANPKVAPSESLISDEKMVKAATLNMKDRMTAALILELETQIDSSGNFSDASRSRSTYGLASYEDTDGGVISLAQLEDMIENQQSSTYGNCTSPETELVLAMPRNQLTNIARAGAASAGVSFNETNFVMTADSQSGATIDTGRVTRTKTFEGVPIMVIPGMTSEVILSLRRGTITMDMHMTPLYKEIAQAGFQRLIAVACGMNVVTWIPSWNAKISGLTA